MISQLFYLYCFLQLGLFFVLLVLLLLFQEGRSLQHFLLLLLLRTEDRVRILSPAGVSLAFRESPVAISVRLVGGVFTCIRGVAQSVLQAWTGRTQPSVPLSLGVNYPLVFLKLL